MNTEFWQYKLDTCWKDEHGYHDELLCIGERIKKGTFRPCLKKAVPFSSLVGALHGALGLPYSVDLYAAGYIDNPESSPPKIEYIVTAPTDAAIGCVKSPAPITIQALRGVTAQIFIKLSSDEIKRSLEDAGASFDITLGAMKSVGFGRCRLTRVSGNVPLTTVKGKLLSRIPEKHSGHFGISKVIKPNYGYLFERKDEFSGIYIRSLYEGSIVEGYSFLVREEAK